MNLIPHHTKKKTISFLIDHQIFTFFLVSRSAGLTGPVAKQHMSKNK